MALNITNITSKYWDRVWIEETVNELSKQDDKQQESNDLIVS